MVSLFIFIILFYNSSIVKYSRLCFIVEYMRKECCNASTSNVGRTEKEGKRTGKIPQEIRIATRRTQQKDLSGITQIDENSLHIFETDMVPWAEEDGTSMGTSKFYVFGNSDIGEFCVKFGIDWNKTDTDDYGAIMGSVTDGVFWKTNFTDLPLPLMKLLAKMQSSATRSMGKYVTQCWIAFGSSTEIGTFENVMLTGGHPNGCPFLLYGDNEGMK